MAASVYGRTGKLRAGSQVELNKGTNLGDRGGCGEYVRMCRYHMSTQSGSQVELEKGVHVLWKALPACRWHRR